MKLKDYITLANLLAGLGAVVALIERDFNTACYLIFLGTLGLALTLARRKVPS